MNLNKGLILVVISIIACSTVFAGGAQKGKTILFEDGWENLKPIEGEKQTGNFTSFSLLGEPKQRPNKKWTCTWANWGMLGTDGHVTRGVVMVANRQVNDDWLISEEIDLNDCKKPVLDIEGYSKYGTEKSNSLKVLISTNFSGGVKSANWDELPLESFHKNKNAPNKQAQIRHIDLKKYVGKKVFIAFRSIHKSENLRNLSRITSLAKVEVVAFKK